MTDNTGTAKRGPFLLYAVHVRGWRVQVPSQPAPEKVLEAVNETSVMKRRYLTFRAVASILKSFAGGGSSDRMTRKALTSRL
jgi:hypothetical protein